MIDVNVVSWRSPLSFDAGSIQVNICVQVLWAHYIYIFYNLNLLKYMFIFNECFEKKEKLFQDQHLSKKKSLI